MIFVSAQPDELMFAWQTLVQLKNFKEIGVDLSKVYVLVAVKNSNIELSDTWKTIDQTYPEINLLVFEDKRISKRYASSIRPHLLSQFFKNNPNLVDEYMFYYDSDVLLSELPAFEAMEDDRWHVSKADYISWNYIEEKKSISLENIMLNAVGVPKEIVKEKGQEVGGVQYFIYGTEFDFWDKIEQDCERMYSTYHDNFKTISKEFQAHFGREMTGNDFQIWCTDMWCIYWNALLFGVDVYVNPELDFVWPKDSIDRLNQTKIYHDSGIDVNEKDYWFYKGSYTNRNPFTDDLSKLASPHNAQSFYINYIEKVKQDLYNNDELLPVADQPLVSCLMTTYGRFECVERSIAFWLLQDYENKELVIYNTAERPLVLSEELKNLKITIINQSTFADGTPYTNVGQIRQEVIKLALGQYYICWDDDDIYLPWHISQGMKYIVKNNKRAYIPKKSFWSPDAGNTFEYAQNSMEAACIINLDDIKRYGFNDSNGGEHTSWRRGLVDEGLLDENNDVYPLESYGYLWGEEIASHKQSGSINNPNCFEEHKAASIDFGIRPLSYYSPLRITIWFHKISKFVNNPVFTSKLESYNV